MGKNENRRKLLKSIAAGSGAVVVGKSLPESWSKPVIDSVVLPAHASTTDDTGSEGPEATTTATVLCGGCYSAERESYEVPEGLPPGIVQAAVTYYLSTDCSGEENIPLPTGSVALARNAVEAQSFLNCQSEGGTATQIATLEGSDCSLWTCSIQD